MGTSCSQDEQGSPDVTELAKEISGHFGPEFAAKAVCDLVRILLLASRTRLGKQRLPGVLAPLLARPCAHSENPIR